MANASAPEPARTDSRDTLLRVLSGGYDLETRLKVVRGLIGNVDVSLNSLLREHLESIRAEARAAGEEDLAVELEQLSKRLERSEN